MNIVTGIEYIQPRGRMFCLHVGSVAVLFGPKRDTAVARLELFTPLHRFRLSKWWGR